MATHIITLWQHTLLLYGIIHYYFMATYITTLWQHTLLHYGNIHYYIMATYIITLWQHTLLEETGGPGENYPPVTSLTLSHNVESSTKYRT
jgi:hypothetical protein